MSPALVLIFAVFATAMVLLEGVLAYKDGLFSVQQLRDRGFKKGLPFVFHGAMWTDLLIINPIMVMSLLLYGNQWSSTSILVIGTSMLLLTVAMHLVYATSKTPDPLAWNGKVTPAGCVHVVYMWIGLTIVGLIYFDTPNINHAFLVVVSALLALHIFIGSQMLLNILQPAWWGKTPATDIGSVVTVAVVWMALSWRCWYIMSH